jgi:hypothetical protein
MDRLPHDPRNFREVVEADLRRAARLIVKVQDEIDPQLRMATPEGDYHLAVTLPADAYGRKVIFRNLALFMAWKQALGFTLASELYEPDSLYCVGFMGRRASRLPGADRARAEALDGQEFRGGRVAAGQLD